MRKGSSIGSLSLRPRLVRLKVDIIMVAGGIQHSRAAKNATKTIPIMSCGHGSDPVGAGWLKALRVPAGTSPALRPLAGIRRKTPGAAQRGRSPKFRVSPFSHIPTIRALRAELKEDLQVGRGSCGVEPFSPGRSRDANGFGNVYSLR